MATMGFDRPTLFSIGHFVRQEKIKEEKMSGQKFKMTGEIYNMTGEYMLRCWKQTIQQLKQSRAGPPTSSVILHISKDLLFGIRNPNKEFIYYIILKI